MKRQMVRLFHVVGWHRFCKPVWRRVGMTNGTTQSANTTVGVLLLADYREHTA